VHQHAARVGEDPVKHGLVASLARPGGNATGVNSFSQEVNAKLLALLHELVPKALRVAVLLNPASGPNAETTLRGVSEAARPLGLQIRVLNASTSREIDAAFATLARERPDALFFRLLMPEAPVKMRERLGPAELSPTVSPAGPCVFRGRGPLYGLRMSLPGRGDNCGVYRSPLGNARKMGVMVVATTACAL
jgi:ABC transporter substrate binding protein